jgi:hypothetical protein
LNLQGPDSSQFCHKSAHKAGRYRSGKSESDQRYKVRTNVRIKGNFKEKSEEPGSVCDDSAKASDISEDNQVETRASQHHKAPVHWKRPHSLELVRSLPMFCLSRSHTRLQICVYRVHKAPRDKPRRICACHTTVSDRRSKSPGEQKR